MRVYSARSMTGGQETRTSYGTNDGVRAGEGSPAGDLPINLEDLRSPEGRGGLEARFAFSDQDKPSLGDLFATRIAPTLLRVSKFDIGDPQADVPASITAMLADNESRGIVWGYLTENGLPKFYLERHQVHALVAGLLQYDNQDESTAYPALVNVAKCVTRIYSRDKELYQALGDFFRDRQLAPDLLAELAVPFRNLETHNVELDRDLLPWRDLFKAQADESLLRGFLSEAADRMYRRQFSTYDHLLSVVCGAEKVNLLPNLERVLFPNQGELVPTLRDVAVSFLREFGRVFVKHASRWSAIFILVGLMDWASAGVGPFFAFVGLGTAVSGLASSAVQCLGRGVSAFAKRSALQDDFIRYVSSPTFSDFKRQVFEKLSGQGERPELVPLIKRLGDDLNATR